MDELAAGAAMAVPSAMATVDERGVITWANAAWLRSGSKEAAGVFANAIVGADLLEQLVALRTPEAREIGAQIRAVLDGATNSSERTLRDGAGSWVLYVGGLVDQRRGAVLVRTRAGPPVEGPAPTRRLPDGQRLTVREHEVLAHMARGLDNRAIAAELGVAYTTVRSHVRSIIEKLQARSRLDAVVRANRDGLLR